MNCLADLRMFSEIACSPSMASAANRLGMAPATISGRLKALEDHYGVALVRRTTRSLFLTDEGKLLLERARPVLSGFADLERDMGGRRTAVSGSLVLSSAADVSRVHLLPLVRAFARAYPRLQLTLRFDAPGSLHEIPFDVALRAGPVRDSNLTIRNLFSMETVTCAAPAYLAEYGTPAHPADLRRHECLRLEGSSFAGNDWTFGNVATTVAVGGRFQASDPATLKNFAVQGLGILRTALADVDAELASGLLVPVLGGFESEPQPVCLLSDSRRRLPARTSEFLDFARAYVRPISSGRRCPVPMPSKDAVQEKA